MTKPICSVLAIAVACVGMIVTPAALRAAVKVGDTPALAFFDQISHERMSLADFKGNLVLVDFWAASNPASMDEAPRKVTINERLYPQGLQIIGVNLDTNIKIMFDAVKAQEFKWPQMCDGMGMFGPAPKEWGVTALPIAYLIGPDGKVLWIGKINDAEEQIVQIFKEHPPQLCPPEVLASATETVDKMAQAVEAKNFPAALEMLLGLPASVRRGPLAERINQLQEEIVIPFQTKLSEAGRLINEKKYQEAMNQYVDVISKAHTLPVAATAHTQLAALLAKPDAKKQIDATGRFGNAEQSFLEAQKLKSENNRKGALARFKFVASSFAGTPAALTAAEEIAAMEGSAPPAARADNAASKPAATAARTTAAGTAPTAESNPKAKAALDMANAYLSAGKPALAQKKYQTIIEQFPGTAEAAQAKKALAAMAEQSQEAPGK